MELSSHLFGGDPSPGTLKNLEVHYACAAEGVQVSGRVGGGAPPSSSSASGGGRRRHKLPGWLYENGAADLWEEDADVVGGAEVDLDYGEGDNFDSDEDEDSSPAVERKPILVEPTTTPPLRIPITTPRVQITTTSSSTPRPVGNRRGESKREKLMADRAFWQCGRKW